MKKCLKKGTASPSKCRKMPWFWASKKPARPLEESTNGEVQTCKKPKGWTLMVGTWISCWAWPVFRGYWWCCICFFSGRLSRNRLHKSCRKLNSHLLRPVDQIPTDNFSQFLNFFDLTKHARERSKVPKNVRVLSQTFFLQMSWYVQESICATTWKINMEPTSHPFRKENDLPNLHDYVPC